MRRRTAFKTKGEYEEHKYMLIKNLRNVPGYTSYYISRAGDVYRFYDKTKSYVKLKSRINNSGYQRIRLVADSGKRKEKEFTLSRLVLRVFNPTEGSKKLTAHHKDGDRSNNSICNLEWLSRRDHMRLHSDQNKKRKLRGKYMTKAEQLRLVWLKHSGLTIKQLSEYFDISQKTVVNTYKRFRFAVDTPR